VKPDEIRGVVAELNALLAGARVQNVWDAGERAWVLKLRLPGQNVLVLVCARKAFARVHALEERPPAPASPGAFCQALRAHLDGARFVEVRQPRGDRRLELVFERGRYSDDGVAEHSWSFVVQLFGAAPEAVLLDDSNRVLASAGECAGGTTRFLAGTRYQPPAPKPGDSSLEASDSGDGSVSSDEQDPLALNRVVAERLAALELGALLDDAHRRVTKSISAIRKRSDRLIEKVEKDLEGARSRDKDRELGELLKGSFGLLKRGLKSVEVVDYFDPEMPTVTIALDPKLGPPENIERYFKRYRKAKRAVPILEKRLDEIETTILTLDEIAGSVESATTLEDFAEIERRLAPLVKKRGQKVGGANKKGVASTPASGPRRFVSADGYEILVGRNSRQNDELSLKIARGNDLFLHVCGKPGAHVIIRTVAGKSVPPQTLLDAAQLAVYYSLPIRSSGVLVAGATAEVDYTPAKFVHKPKGAKAGLVLLQRHKSLRIQLEEDVISRLRSSSSGDRDGGD